MLVAVSRRDDLFDYLSDKKFVIARTRSPTRETRALPRKHSSR